MLNHVRTRVHISARVTATILAAVVLIVVTIGFAPSSAAQNLKLPEFQRCEAAGQPRLPQRWRSTALLEPFKTPRLLNSFQLAVGEFTGDTTLPAMRATIHGLQAQSFDLLVAPESTYLLTGPSANPTGCQPLGPIWQPPSDNWLSDQAQCVGEAPLIETEVEWWKMPAKPDPATTWHWFSKDRRLPWRSLFASPSDALAVLGQYAMAYYPEFTPVDSTNLPGLLEFCRSQTTDAVDPAPARDDLRAFITDHPNPELEAEREASIGGLIPGLSLAACDDQTLPSWPAHGNLGFTTFMTPVKFSNDPFPTEILYQWQTRSQRTRLVYPSSSPQEFGDALLIGGNGYGIDRMRYGNVSCAPGVMPGTPQPNWPVLGNCTCRGVLDDNPALSPDRVTQVLSCDMEPPSVFWTWYTDAMKPVVFYQTESAPDVGTGLALADYYDWQPGAAIPSGTFALPSQCIGAKRPPIPPLSTDCFTCHLGKP